MANEKIINTRVQLKYDSLENWANKNPTLKAGEMAIAYLPPKGNGTAPDAISEAVLFKVGPGAFNTLPWGSALAADVYKWAKETNLFTSIEANTTTSGDKTYTGNAVTGIEWDSTLNGGKGGLKFTKATQFATKAELDAALDAFGGDLDAITDNNTKYTIVMGEGDHAGQLAITEINYINGAAEGNGTTTYIDFVTPEELTETLKGYYTSGKVDELIQGVKDQIPTEVGVMSAAGAGAVTVTGDKNVTVSLVLDNSGNVEFEQSTTGLKAVVDTKTSKEIEDDIATALQAAQKYADDNDANTEYHVEYDSVAKQIKLVAGADASKMTIDATDFIKDGMVQTVELVQQDGEGNEGQFIKITWNDDGNDVTYVSVGALVDVYTAAANASEVQVAISNKNEVSATLVNKGVTEAKLEQNVQDALALARTAIQSHQDITGKADKVTSATAGNFAGLDTNGNITDSGKKAADFATKAQGDKADTALQPDDVGTMAAESKDDYVAKIDYTKVTSTKDGIVPKEWYEDLNNFVNTHNIDESGLFNEPIIVGEDFTEHSELNKNGLSISTDAVQGTTSYTLNQIHRTYSDTDGSHIYNYNYPDASGELMVASEDIVYVFNCGDASSPF